MQTAFTTSLGRFVLEPASRGLLVDGEPIKIGARAFDLLAVLIERRERVVSKDELMERVWPGVSVEESNLQVQVSALRKLLGADAIATLPGRGYQFVAVDPAAPVVDPLSRWARWERRWGAFAATLVAALVLASWLTLRPRAAPESSLPVLAAMPFRATGDPLAAQLAAGVTADVATDFARIRNLRVIADSVTGAYAHADADAREIARDLRAQYVLTGAVQRQGEAVQISATLTDGVSGEAVWSNRWRGATGDDLIAFQTEVADSVASTLGSRNFLVLRAIAPARAKATGERTAYDWFALGYSEYLKGTPEGFAAAEKSFDAAIALEPHMTLAIVQRSYAAILHAVVAHSGFAEATAEWEQFARQGIAANPLDAEPHIALAMVRSVMGATAEGRAELERGLALDPSSADVSVKAAWVATILGEPQRAAMLCDRAFRHNSVPVVWYGIHCYAAYYFVGRYSETIDMVRRTANWIGEDASRLAFELAAEAD